LDCESRSAVDWAAYLGQHINELTFFNRLPKSDNPDKGFVGNVYGAWGQIPPNPYGVHAEPVAALLRDYGLQAYAHRPLRWEQLQAEIAAEIAVSLGDPVAIQLICYDEAVEILSMVDDYTTIYDLDWFGCDGTARSGTILNDFPDQAIHVKL